MSTTLTKRSLAVAAAEAAEFRALFDGLFERWEVAGSIRRRKSEVGDVEHVVLAKFGEVPKTGGLFAERVTVNLVLSKLDELVASHAVSKHLYNGSPRWGEKFRGADFRGFNHEVSLADSDGSNWGPTLAIKTGPAEFSQMLVTSMQARGYRNRLGYVWNWRAWTCACGWSGDNVQYVKTNDPARKQMRLSGGWTDKLRDGTEMTATCLKCGKHDQLTPAKVSVPTEQEYFEICGVAWREPSERR